MTESNQEFVDRGMSEAHTRADAQTAADAAETDRSRSTTTGSDVVRIAEEVSEPPLVQEFGVRQEEVAVSLVVDLIERMEKAETQLTLLAGIEDQQGDKEEAARLHAKSKGVALCLSYAREALRIQS